jgi:hypothetical protein
MLSFNQGIATKKWASKTPAPTIKKVVNIIV